MLGLKEHTLFSPSCATNAFQKWFPVETRGDTHPPPLVFKPQRQYVAHQHIPKTPGKLPQWHHKFLLADINDTDINTDTPGNLQNEQVFLTKNQCSKCNTVTCCSARIFKIFPVYEGNQRLKQAPHTWKSENRPRITSLTVVGFSPFLVWRCVTQDNLA